MASADAVAGACAVAPMPVQASLALSSGSRELIAGMLSGAAGKLIEYPFDTVKVIQQTMGSRYNGTVDCVVQTYRGGGVASFFRGLTPPLIGAMAENSTLFVAYGLMKQVLAVDEDRATLSEPIPMWKYLVSGGFGGACGALVLTPVELVKCRMQVQTGAATAGGRPLSGQVYSGPLDCAVKTVRAEGLSGLWRGNTACMMREVPGNMAWFGMYELSMKGIQSSLGLERKADVPLAWTAAAGSVAGVSYWVVPYPADTAKSKQQSDPRFGSMSLSQALRVVAREEGMRGLYRGMGITAFRAAPSNAVLFFAYEAIDRMLRRL